MVKPDACIVKFIRERRPTMLIRKGDEPSTTLQAAKNPQVPLSALDPGQIITKEAMPTL